MYYVHEVVDSEGNVFAWSNKKEETTSDRLLAANGSLDTVVDSSANSISSKSQNVNPEDTLYSSRNAQQTRSIVTQSEEIRNAWVEAATDAVVNYNLQDGQKNNTPGGVRYSARRLSDQIDDIANQTFDVRNHVYYGTTPRALSNILSIPIMPMLGTQTHAYAMALSKQQAQNEGRRTSGLHFHELGWDTVKAIPDMLSHPLAVIKSNTDATDSRFVVVTNATDKEGRPIIAAIAPKGSGKYYNLDMMATAFSTPVQLIASTLPSAYLTSTQAVSILNSQEIILSILSSQKQK